MCATEITKETRRKREVQQLLISLMGGAMSNCDYGCHGIIRGWI